MISIQRNLFYLNEKLATLIHSGGTIDYEEYFNRRILGYAKSFSPAGVWSFTQKSNYGNGDNSGRPLLYLCGISGTGTITEDACLANNAVTQAGGNALSFNETLGGKQMAYGQYREIGFNYASAAGYPTPIKLPPIFPENDPNINPDEGTTDLYLIKKLPSGTYERTYFRHVYVQDPSIEANYLVCNPASSLDGCLGKIQMARLTSCDSLPIAGGDGILDAWAPHADF